MTRAPRPPLTRDARLLLVGVAIDAFGTGLTLPFLVVYLHQLHGIPLQTIGLIVAVPSAVALVLLAPLGALVDSAGPRRVQMAALGSAAAGAALMSQVDGVGVALLARVLMGLGWAAFWPANNSLVAAVLPSEQRPRYFGVSFALLNAGIGVGGIVGAVYVDVARPATFSTVYLVDAVTFLVPLALFALPLRHVGGPPPDRPPAEAGAPAYRDVLTDPVFRRVLAVVFVSAFVGYGQVEGGWTAYATAIARVPTQTIGLAFTANTTVIVLSQLVVLRLIEGRRRTRLLALLAALWVASWAVMGIAAFHPATATASTLVVSAFAIFAVGETLLSPVSPALINDVASDHLRGRYNATAGIAFQLAAIGAPAIAGVVLGGGHGRIFILMLVVGCGVLAALAFALESRLSPHANGVAPRDRAALTR
jgi:MFS family permease